MNSLNHFTKTKAFAESHLESLLKDMKGFKFIETLEVTFVKNITTDSINKTTSLIYKKAFFNGKAKTITKPNDIEPELNISRHEILNMIDQWVSEGSGWAIDLMSFMAWVKRCYSEKSKNLNKLLVFEALYP